VSEQVVGAAWLHAAPFAYAGSIGPVELPPTVRGQVERIGSAIAAEFGLVGLIGVDLVLDGTRVWPIEVNPRFPASVEVLERSGDFSAVAWHVRACRGGRLPVETSEGARPKERLELCGKAVLCAPRDVVVGHSLATMLTDWAADAYRPLAADLPHVESQIGRGRPICTILADAVSRQDLESALRRRAAVIEGLL
jgi:predicted ATP-grasp superfamily ATP-dependent carboligase